MLPKWLQDRLAPGYRKQINTLSQYQAAAGYLRSQMQELVANPCPDVQDVTNYQQLLDTLADKLQQLQDTLPSLEDRLQQLTKQQEHLEQHSEILPAEALSLSQSIEGMDGRLRSLEQNLRAPLPDTYEDTMLLLEAWQQEHQKAQLQLSALKQLASREPLGDLSQALPREQHANRELYLSVRNQLSLTDTLTQQLHGLGQALDRDIEKLGNCLALHRRFLQKDGAIQLQFDVLNRQVPALLSQASASSDWYDLVQSWYKANNLANSTIKSLTALTADYGPIIARHRSLSQQTVQIEPRLNHLLPAPRAEALQEPLTHFRNTVTGLQQQILQQEQLLDQLLEQRDSLREQARKNALEEVAHLRKLWTALETVTSHYVSRKEALSTRGLFEQIQAILKTPYCLRTLHRSPIPGTLIQAEDYGQYLTLCNREFLSREMTRLDTYFSQLKGKNLTEAQRKAVLTEEDYIQVMGQKGFGKSFTLEAKKQYLLEQLQYAPRQILVWKPGQSTQTQVLGLLQSAGSQVPQALTNVWVWQEKLKQLLPQREAWDILLPALELYQYLCPAGYRLPLSKEPLLAFSGEERESAEVLYQDFRILVQLYEKLLAENQLLDCHQALYRVTQLFQSGQLTPDYTHCLVDDFPALSPLELALLRSLLKSNPRTKLFCTGDSWEPLDELSYIKTHFPRLPWTHFLVQELLAEGKQFITARNYQGGYLSLTETKGEVILLTPLGE